MIFVSYTFFSKTKHGFGSINIDVDGLYSMKDVNKITETIRPICIEELKTNEDIELVILNWRKFDTEG
jgi:hypothetical protein